LGMVRIGGTDFVLADLPGLIEGAHEGAGLGTRFLGHAERTSVILHLVDGTEADIVQNYKTIRGELGAYGQGLSDKPEIVALNKVDAIPKEELKKKQKALTKAAGKDVFLISSVSGEGVDDLLHALARAVEAKRSAERMTTEPKRSWAP
jgi:GTPase